MAEFRKVQRAELSPTRCVSCGDHQGPFIDLGVTVPVHGHLYLCASIPDQRPGCVQQAARLDSMIETSRLQTAENHIGQLEETIERLRDRLQGDKFVRLDDVVAYLEERL